MYPAGYNIAQAEVYHVNNAIHVVDVAWIICIAIGVSIGNQFGKNLKFRIHG